MYQACLLFCPVSLSLPFLCTGLCHQVLVKQYNVNQYSFRELHLFLAININRLITWCVYLLVSIVKTPEFEASNLWAVRMKIALLLHCRSERNGYLLETFHLAWHITNSTSLISFLVLYQYLHVADCLSVLYHFSQIHSFVEFCPLHQQSGLKHGMPSDYYISLYCFS